MKLIADAGSTKTDWCLLNMNGDVQRKSTSGINPVYQDEQEITVIFEKEFSIGKQDIDAIYFYGAGCINEYFSNKIRRSLGSFFRCENIDVYTDMMGAARALCGHEEGIACILGTGSNSCYYDGRDIQANVSPLGYIIGDEGSGAVLGKKFIADLMKNQLSERIKELFYSQYVLQPHEIIQRIYKEPFPNRFLAQFTRFIHEHIHEPALSGIVKSSFIEFFERNIKQYPESSRLPVHFSGSIAFYFSSLLKEAASQTGFTIGKIISSPMEGLMRFHSEP